MLNVASVGLGWVTTNRHIPSLQRHPGVRLVGVVDADEQKARALAAKLGVEFASDLDAPWLNNVQALTVGTPPETHCNVVLQGLGRGFHVLVEKPFAMSTEQARQMLTAAEESKRTLAVVHNFQFARAVAQARQRLQNGKLGELRAVLGLQFSNHNRRLPAWYKELPLGLFYDEAPHLLYLVRSFVPDFAIDQATVFRGRDATDNTPSLVSIAHSGRHTVSIQMLFDTALSEWQLVLLGSKETLVADIFRDILVRLPPDNRHESLDVLRTSGFAAGTHLLGTVTSGLRHLRKTLDYGNDEVVRRFVAAIQSGEAPVGIAGRDGLAVVEAMQTVVSCAGKPAA